MKKIIILVVAILIIGLVGCAPKTDISHSDNENVVQSGDTIEDDNKVISGENVSQNTELSEEELIKKYKLSDNYILEDDDIQEISYNVLAPVIDEENRITDDRIINNQEVISDGTNFKITCTKIGKHEIGGHDIFEIKINDKIFEIDYNESSEKVGTLLHNFVGVIDLEPTDEYKEIVVRIGLGMETEFHLYKLTSTGIELIYKYQLIDVSEYGLVIVNDRYVIPVSANMVNDNLVMGYYMYEDGKFKYIDRFLTGEKIKDENGNYTENFRNQVFTAQSEGSRLCQVYYNGNIVNIGGKVKFLKQSKNENGYIYDVELVEDSLIWIGTQEITLPKGTILRNL